MAADEKSSPPCHPQACAIQSCLQRNHYDEDKCKASVRALYECCQAFYRTCGDKATTPSCPKPNLLRRKMTQLDEAS